MLDNHFAELRVIVSGSSYWLTHRLSLSVNCSVIVFRSATSFSNLSRLGFFFSLTNSMAMIATRIDNERPKAITPCVPLKNTAEAMARITDVSNRYFRI